MSQLTDLLAAGMALIEGQAPAAVTIGGIEYPCTLDYVGHKETFGAGSTRQREADYDLTIVIRKDVMAVTPRISAIAVVSAVEYRVVETRVDEVSFILFLDSKNK